MLFSFIF